MSKAKDVASKGNSSSKQIKHKSAKNKGVSSLKNVSSQNANNASGRIGVAAVALASTLSMLLPGATALAKTSFNADSFDSSYVNSVAKASGKGAGNGAGKGSGKGKGDGNDLYKNGLLNTGTTSERAMRQMVGSVKEYLVKNADSNADSNASAEGVNNQEAAAGDSSVSVKDSGERSDAGSEAATDSATESATKGEQDNSDVAKPKNKAVEKEQTAEVKPSETPASKTEPAKSEPAKTDSAKPEVVNPATESKTDSANSEPAAKTDSETKTNSSAKTEADQKSAQPANTENAKPENAQTAQSASTENAKPENAQNAQPVAKNEKEKAAPAIENADSENAKTAAEQPAAEQSASTESAQPTAKAKNDSTTPRVRNRRDTNQNAQNPNNGGSVTPADNAPETPSASAPSAGTESSAGVGATENTDSKEPVAEKPVAEKPVAKEQGTEGNANGAVADRSGEGANGSNSDSNANSQVIKPNEKNPEASDQNTANSQVQTDKKPEATYNLKILYTINGAPNKQLVQPYELTIDEAKLNELDEPENYVYVKLPQSAGYRPAIYHSGDYQYYIEKGKDGKGKNKYVVDDGTNADAVRYLRINKKLITDYAVKQRQAVGGSSSDQTSQNPSPTQQGAKDGIQYYGELNINYAPKTAKYYVRHMLQEAGKDEFKEDEDVPGAKTITVGGKEIHVTEVTGTVGSNVSAVSVYIPGYEPEHNLISSPLSDSEDEKDKLVLNLRYYRKAYTVTYDSAGGTDITAQKVYYQKSVPPVTNPTKRGYTFKGWHIVDPAEGTENTQKVNFDDSFRMKDHDVKLRAVWEANKTTSYRVNVWVQKADLVDKEHPDSLVNYDFVGLVERNNVKTGSSVDLNNMNDAGVAKDTSKLNGTDKDNPISDPELGLTKEELQGKDSDHKDGLIAKFNWMNDTPVTSLDGYNTDNPDDPNNYTISGSKRVYKDKFTRYFYVNKKLTKRYTKDPNNTSTKLFANDLDNTFDLVYNRKTYELIFAKPNNIKTEMGANNAVIHKKNRKGEIISYCYAGGGDCSDKLDNKSTYTYGNSSNEVTSKVDHKGYRVNVRYGQSLTDFWPNSDEVDFMDDGNTSSLGFVIGGNFDGATYGTYRDTPPFRLTKEEFVDPKFHWMYKDGKAPQISDNPADDSAPKYTVKDDQRLLILDSRDNSQRRQADPIQVIIKKQSIASAKNGDTGDDIKYELSTDSYSKDDTSSGDYVFPPSSIAGFESKITGLKPDNSNRKDGVKIKERFDADDFYTKVHDLYEEVTGEDTPDDPPEEDKDTFPDPDYTSDEDGDDGGLALKNLNDAIAERLKTDPAYKKYYEFKKKYHLEFRRYYAGVEEKLKFGVENNPSPFDKNNWLEMKYNRQSYAVQFYNADGNAIKDSSGVAKEKLPYEYSLTKRGNDKLTGEDADLYYNKGAVKSYDASVVKDDLGNTSKQFDGKYTFKLNGKTYSIVRPADLPEDYVFKGWAVDQAGIHLINGETNDNSEGAEGGSKSGSKAKGEVKDYTMPVNGIKLYAAWGKPEGIKHTVTLDYNMPQIDGNGNEISGSHVVTETKYPRYQSIDEKKIGTPTRKGYDFYGWELAKKGGVKVADHTPYAFSNQVVEDITLRAVWVKDTRYNGTFKHVFLKPGVTFKQYNDAKKTHTEAALVDHVSTQTVSGLREHLRYNAEAVYSDETHFPDKHFTSFEASKDESKNTGEFVYQTYNTRKYKVHYVTVDKDGNKKELLPESEVSSVNQKYDVAFYKPIEGFMPRESQQNIEYTTDDDGKQTSDKEITFTYDDVRVLKRKDDTQARPTNYTRYVFKVADGEQNMGSIADYSGHTAGKDGLVYDVIGGTKAYQMPLPQDPVAKQGYEFAGWIVKKTVKDAHSVEKEVDGINRLPVLSETQTDPKVVYTATFKLKAPVANDLKVLTPTQSLGSNYTAKDLIKNANEYPEGATFSFASGATFDSTPGLHKIKVQVHLDGNTADTEVLYRVLPDLVYASDWEKFKTSDYGSKHKDEYVPITFTGDLKQGMILGHDGETSEDKPSLVAYVYKDKKDISVRVPQAFGKEYEKDNYHYVFKGWATKVVQPTTDNPNPEQKFDINASDRYTSVTLKDGVTYHAVYKKIEYFSSSSDGGEVPKDAVVAIFKPAPGRLWDDKTSGPKVFYVKKGTDLEKITKNGSKALDWLNSQLTGAKGTWSRSSMRNDGSDVKAIEPVKSWIVNESFQEFVADQTPLATPDAKNDTLLAIRGDKSTLPSPEKYIANYDSLIDKTKNPNVKSVKVEYASTAPTVDKAGVYTVPLIVRVTYNDFKDPSTHKDYYDYKIVGKLKVMHDLIYGDKNTDTTKPGSTTPLTPEQKAEQAKIKEHYAEIKFVNSFNSQSAEQGSSSSAESEGTIDGRKIYYTYKNITAKSSGVKAPQAVGQDYDAKGYHYEFQGWEMHEGTTSVANSANTPNTANGANIAAPVPVMTLYAATAPSPTTMPNPQEVKLYSNAEIADLKFDKDTTFVAVYKLVKNVIDASTTKKALEGYIPAVFLPEIGHRWMDGEYKPKLLYIRPSTKDRNINISFMKKVAGDTGKELYGFSKWRMFTAQGAKLNTSVDSSWDISAPLMFVAEQTGVSDITIPETIVSAGDAIPDVNKLVHNTDSRVTVKINHIYGQGVKPKDSKETDDSKRVYRPGTATVVVDVTRPTDVEGQKLTTQIPIRVRVLPNVIADQDLPAAGTIEDEFISKNYTKFTYVTDPNGKMMSNVHTYWVRKGKESAIKDYIPDVLANNGYVFKDWMTLSSLNKDDNRKASDSDREALAKIAELRGENYLARIIRGSKNSTLAALKNLLLETKPSEYMQYAASREKLARIAEDSGKSFVASIIRKSEKSSIADLENLLAEAGVKDARIVLPNVETDTIIVANFEQMDSVEFKFSGKAVEGVPATFTLANLTRGVLNADGTTNATATVSVDNKQFIVNALSSSSLEQLGISHSCSGTTCTISGTPKIVDGKKIVELTFTSVDKYGRKAVVTVDIEVLPASNDVNPTPVPAPAPTPTPEPDQAEPDYSTVPSDYVVPAPVPMPMPAPAPAEPLPDEQKTVVKGDLLPQTGVDASQSALIASLLASVGFVGFAAKHRRKREDGKNN
ncbi:InlB B-repeat-containing protein [Gardnerella vaginalis]|uniref:Repeat protein n=1 Tax=Gardnerella vaginalis TaxID=2702 RepID=A0A133NMG3_GARVA|nr:InlB B-repeat-containing protein [Gardnerella vaginalis]KXA17484.1 repeat protein [Gardnerella vaginalis]